MKKQRRKFIFLKPDANISLLPWCISESTFYEHCTRCHACFNACETRIIQIDNFGFPFVDFTKGKGECHFCYACADACALPLFFKKNERPWGLSVKINSACLSLRHIECRVCNESCDEQAIQFLPKIGGYQIVLEQEKCTGCGACLKPCPVNAIELISSSHLVTEPE